MSERESLEVDVLVVGGGPAGLAAAYHLRQLKKDLSIAVLEKGKEIGAHIISGAVMDPRGLDELMPDWKEKGGPIENPVEEDHVVFLTENHKFSLPIVPPPLRNHGNYIISLNKFTRWFGEQVEKNGADIFRLWVASSDFTEDLRMGSDVVQASVDEGPLQILLHGPVDEQVVGAGVGMGPDQFPHRLPQKVIEVDVIVLGQTRGVAGLVGHGDGPFLALRSGLSHLDLLVWDGWSIGHL